MCSMINQELKKFNHRSSISKTVMDSVSAGEYSGSPCSVFVEDPPTHHYCPQTDRVSLPFDCQAIITKHHGFGKASNLRDALVSHFALM